MRGDQATTIRPPRRLLAVKMNNYVDEQPRVPSGTWPHRKRQKKPRPATATLAKPRLLDVSLLGKIDMSMMRKELLSVYRLMRVEKKPKENIVLEIEPIVKKPPSTFRLYNAAKKKVDAAFAAAPVLSLPKPCDSCGRESRPERLHAHPKRTCPKDKRSASESRSPKPETTSSCCYCGRRFGSLLLSAHESKCRQKKQSGEKDDSQSKECPPRNPSPRKSSQKKVDEDVHEPKKHTGRTSLNVAVITPRLTLHPTAAASEVEDSCTEDAPHPEEDIEWKNHLQSLVKCTVCDRAFAPDRVLRHQAICDGSSKRQTGDNRRSGLRKSP